MGADMASPPPPASLSATGPAPRKKILVRKSVKPVAPSASSGSVGMVTEGEHPKSAGSTLSSYGYTAGEFGGLDTMAPGAAKTKLTPVPPRGYG
jgi:hypothetical protein